jgi:GNAT superfamily N-acetyltransferase
MADMLVNLYRLPDASALFSRLQDSGITIKRALAPDKSRVLDFIRDTFNQGWADECSAAFAAQPVTCHIAVRGSTLLGFACYDATARGFFGPTGLSPEERGNGVGTALLLASLTAMREAGYGYAAIGWCDDAMEFYRKAAGAIPIPDSSPGIYSRLIAMEGGQPDTVE